MGLFDKNKRKGGFMDEIRCDEPSYLIWKWHPQGSQVGNNNRENAIRWGSSLRVKDGEVAVFVYKQGNEMMQDFIVGPFDQTIKTANFPVLASISHKAINPITILICVILIIIFSLALFFRYFFLSSDMFFSLFMYI